MKKWFTNWISGLRNGADVPYPENIPHLKNIGEKPLRLKPINKCPKKVSFQLYVLFYILSETSKDSRL